MRRIARKERTPDAKQNNLLATLPAAEFARVLADLELVDLALGQVLYESGERLQYVYFPIDSIVSLIYVTRPAARRAPGATSVCNYRG